MKVTRLSTPVVCVSSLTGASLALTAVVRVVGTLGDVSCVASFSGSYRHLSQMMVEIIRVGKIERTKGNSGNGFLCFPEI